MTRWLLGSYELDAELFELRRNGHIVSVQRRVLRLLINLAANAHRVVPKDELLQRVWSGTVVSDGTLRSAVKDARSALGDDHPRLRSVRGYGYQLRIDREVARRDPGGLASFAELEAERRSGRAEPSRRTRFFDAASSEDLARSSRWDIAGRSGEPQTAGGDWTRWPVKISEPVLGRRIARPRLFAELDAALDKRLIWVMGPAGAGKTTLIRTYAEAKALPRIWYRVDDSDIDVASLFFYLREALFAVVRKGTAHRPLPLLTPEYLSGLTTFARRYFDTLFAQLPRPCLIVFDNYQDIANDALWHQVIRQAASSAPPGVHLVFISRAGPHASLAREQAHDEMAILDWDDLRLSRAEAIELARTRSSQLDAKTVAELYELSGGWAAAFTLLLSQARRSSQHAPHMLLEQASQTIFDYFATELFERMPPEEQGFLLRTAVLPHMSEALAQEVTGFEAADRALGRLYRGNLFIERRDTVPLVYEYHPLFRQFLLQRAERALGAELDGLRRRAGRALCLQGQLEAGLELLCQAEDWDGCVPWLLDAAPAFISQGRGQTLEAWIARLPPSVVSDSGWLSYWNGICCLGHRPSDSSVRLRHAFALLRDSGDRAGAYLAWAGVVRAINFQGMLCAPLDEWIDAFEALRSVHPEFPSVEIEAQVVSALLEALTLRDAAAPTTQAWARRALSLASRVGSAAERCATLGSLVHYSVLFGSMQEAAAISEVLSKALDAGLDPLARATVQFAQAAYAWGSGQDEACVNIATRGLREAGSAGIHVLDGYFCALGACATLAVPDLEMARPFLEIMARSAKRNRFSTGNYHFYAAWEALVEGRTEAASQLIQVALDEAEIMDYPLGRVNSRQGQARLLYEARRFSEALSCVIEAKRIAIECGSQMLLRGCLLAEADLAFAVHERDDAVVRLTEALAIGNETGICNMFWLPHELLRRLYQQARAVGLAHTDLSNLIEPLRLVER